MSQLFDQFKAFFFKFDFGENFVMSLAIEIKQNFNSDVMKGKYFGRIQGQ